MSDAGRRRRFCKPGLRLFVTPAGGTLLVIALVILFRSLLARNPYEILLSSVVLILLLVLGLFGVWKARKLEKMQAAWKPPFPMAANAGEETIITGLESRIPLFFRLHFKVKGKYLPCGDSPAFTAPSFASKCCLCARNFFAETSIPRGETSAKIALDFPMSGIFQGEGYCRLKDIFGFFSFACGIPQGRTIKVRSAPCFGKELYINAQSGAEDKRNKQSSDEERYYMREYTPGDRFRDINWKSSEKIDMLITRISPETQEKVSRLEVYFRNYGPAQKPSLEALWLLDRAKARLSYFLRSLKEQQSSFVFDVRSAQGNWEIEDEKDLDDFLEELAGIAYAPLQHENIGITGAKNAEIFVFSTACDAGLQAFLLGCYQRPVTLFLSQPNKGTRDEGRGTRDRGSLSKHEVSSFVFGQKPLSCACSAVPCPLSPNDPEILYKHNFLLKGCIPPLRWLKHNKITPLGVRADRTEINYAGTKL